MARRDDTLMARADAKPKADRTSAEFKRRAAVASALCGNTDFKDWLFDAIDDLRGFARDEGMLTDFGQGIRAAAARLQDRLLVAEESVAFLAELYKRNLQADHERLVEAERKNKIGARK